MKIRRILGCIALLLLSFPLVFALENSRDESMGIHWNVGDSWTIETKTAMSPMSSGAATVIPVQWKFVVEGTDKVQGKICYRTQITCVDQSAPRPSVTIWVDQASGMLVRSTSKVFNGKDYSSYTETYVTENGQPVPVAGNISVLPIDLPVWNNGHGLQTKGLESQYYETIVGDGNTKALGDEIGFLYEVTQEIKPQAATTKSLNDGNVSRNLEVNIRVGSRSAKQIWQKGKPWPIYSSNGITESRLLNYTPKK